VEPWWVPILQTVVSLGCVGYVCWAAHRHREYLRLRAEAHRDDERHYQRIGQAFHELVALADLTNPDELRELIRTAGHESMLSSWGNAILEDSFWHTMG